MNNEGVFTLVKLVFSLEENLFSLKFEPDSFQDTSSDINSKVETPFSVCTSQFAFKLCIKNIHLPK